MIGTVLDRIEAGITLKRAAQIAAAMLAYELAVFLYVFAKLILTDADPVLGHDFAAFWSAAQLAVDGRAAAVFHGDVIRDIQLQVVPLKGTLYWYYPPMMQMWVLPFGLMGYASAFILFTLLGWAIWTYAARRGLPDVAVTTLVLVLSAPIVWSTFYQGQNGALVGLFLVMFVLALERRDNRQAGFWGALLLIKPHLGLLLPLVVIARRQCSVFVWGSLFALLYCGAATLLFGFEYWQALFNTGGRLVRAVLSTQLTDHQISAFGFIQYIGGSLRYGVALQAITAAGAALLTWVIWRAERAGSDLRFATILICSLIVSPYAFYCDAAVSAIALFLLYRIGLKTGFLRGERLAYMLIWLAPIIHLQFDEKFSISVLYPSFLILMMSCYRRHLADAQRAVT
jgi:hypothetical protein